MRELGFDNNIYVQKQTEQILNRISEFDNKLYLEFGGKLFDDYHASRVLPGFEIDSKIRILQGLRDRCEIIIVINAADIEKTKTRSDIGITYDMDVLRLIDNLRRLELPVTAVVIAQYCGQPSADIFRSKLEQRGERTVIHKPIKGYPTDVDLVVSDAGYGANPYIETTKPLVVVTAPGPGSGKMATCLSQLYHEHRRNIQAGYAKYETFPIWNLPLKHPVNLAYEAATADLNDVNMIDPFHLETYGKTAVNYNRDIEIFPIVKTILNRIMGKDLYHSPTDMGVNMAGFCISDDNVCREAAKQEVIRRYYKSSCDCKQGRIDESAVQKIELIMKELGLRVEDRPVVACALERKNACGHMTSSICLPDGSFVTGKTTPLMSSPCAMILNAVKQLAGIADDMLLLSPLVLEPMQKMKREIYGEKAAALTLDEVVIALSISAATNPMVDYAYQKLTLLKGCEAHSTFIVSANDERVLRGLGINHTSEPVYRNKNLYYI